MKMRGMIALAAAALSLGATTTFVTSAADAHVTVVRGNVSSDEHVESGVARGVVSTPSAEAATPHDTRIRMFGGNTAWFYDPSRGHLAACKVRSTGRVGEIGILCGDKMIERR